MKLLPQFAGIKIEQKTFKAFGNEYHRVLKHIGLDGLIKQEYLYRSTKDLS